MKTMVQVTLFLGLSLSTGMAQTPPPAKSAPVSSAPVSRLAPPLAAEQPLPTSPTAAPAAAQQADILKDLPELSPEQLDRYVTFQTRTLSRMFGVNLHYDGMLPQLRRAERPLQMLNPFAPARYGGGFDNLSVNPSSGRGEGINLFAIRF